MKKILLIHILLSIGICTAIAQVPNPAQLQQMRAAELSDEQIRQIVEEMKKNKIGLNEIDGFAAQKGIAPSEAAKLKERIRSLNLDKELESNSAQPPVLKQVNADRSVNDGTTLSARDIQPMTDAERKRSKIFGAELFSNSNLTFEPNLRMPTPANYRLAAGDEVVIDVYGYSEVQHTLKISPEGYIRIPYLGPVYLNGLTIEDAKIRITKQLGSIYSGIKSGNTFVQVSLGSIRSIRVLLIGEIVRPGTYTLPSLATIANALHASGGPNENGSFRNIQVIRNGQPIATFDLYDFLRSGDLTNNIILQDQDIIKINPYTARVELTGEVKRPAIFEVKEGEKLSDVIAMAGGYTDISYRDIVRAYRISNKERSVVNIRQEEIATFQPQSGDKYFIDAILNRFSNRVRISGAVLHPGEYALEDNMSVSDLVGKASGLRDEASRGRAIVFRLNDDYTPSTRSFNLEDVMTGKEVMKLKREDSVVIYSVFDQRESFQVKISGQVNNPGFFTYADSMHIEDLIVMAGGLKDAASLKKVEISRRIRGNESTSADSLLTIIAQFDITSDLTPMAGLVLQPFDEVVVRQAPNYSVQVNVGIAGEVAFPGTYTISTKREKISDLIRRAGGLKPDAYTEGAVMLRKTFINQSDSALLNSKLNVYVNHLKDSADINKVKSSASQRDQLVDINLTQILKQPGSKYDLTLEAGDVISIPKRLQTVQMFGELYFPKKIRYDQSLKFRDYIGSAGGFTNNALRRRSYIVYANGAVKSTRKLLFFNSYPKVKPGAEIYVPKRGERNSLNTQEILGITTGFASLALIIFTVLNKTSN